ncbi:hypothetical protein BJY21_002421 [Kineosphaera limosa]|uniref:FAD-dependent oxidoreductase 2 FAD-binding domain-containing protein n=1 Tax=Kineosphaera limosa NBRC 100340 TaxID=1184609 RepID=K6WWT3_9MICO|nr:FAD-binding dehydrogenase [Kineosphaera limosa]NYE01237.1 hypothetical protein [Kineosphaera limosa]GAB96562.1 hypothetical protein KILIM_042_00060 [Kineosphaera limosa NBRC 100340]
MDADVIVVGAGLAGLVAAAEAADAGRRVVLLDQEGEQSLGGQAFWSLGGLFLIDSPEQRRMGIKDSPELARQDWFGSAQFDREEDRWPRAWAQAYLDFAAGEKRSWLHAMGHRLFPVVGWAERGDGRAEGHGNSVPRFHITWGTGPGIVAPFERRVREHALTGRIRFGARRQVDELIVDQGAVVGVRGTVLAPTTAPRGVASSREALGEFELRAHAVVVTAGGIGGNHDRMWHYVEGLRNWDPIWANHGIRILPGPSSLWLDAAGRRLPAPYFPGFDTLGTLRHLRGTGYDYSWFVLTQRIIEKEFALSGSEQNPDLTGKDLTLTLSRVKPGAPGPVEAFKRHGEDFVVADTLEQLVAGMNALADDDAPTLDPADVRRTIEARDSQIDNAFTKDAQITAIRGARHYRGDRLIRVAPPHRLLDPKAGPLIAVRLHVLSRKTLGGLETDLSGRCLRADGSVVAGLYAAGEVSGFGGGGMMGYNALEGTFLGGCLFSGRVAGRAAAAQTG